MIFTIKAQKIIFCYICFDQVFVKKIKKKFGFQNISVNFI